MSLNTKSKINSYLRLSGVTVVAVYFLILVGGIVRSTGSGMGCPDWPKCFGSIVPPTRVDQLPDNYQQIYLEKRLAKNDRFIATLSSLGFTQTADQLASVIDVRCSIVWSMTWPKELVCISIFSSR